MSTRISIPTQSTCCRTDKHASRHQVGLACSCWGNWYWYYCGVRLLQLDGCNACCSSAAALWENRIRCIPLYQFSLHPRSRLPVSSAEQTVLSKAGQTVGSKPVRLLYIDSIVESCPLTKLNGSLSRLHSADEDAVSWLTSYGSWRAYEKKNKYSSCLVSFLSYLTLKNIVIVKSHTSIVAWYCLKNDHSSLWRTGKLPLLTPKPLNRSSPNLVYLPGSWVPAHLQNFITIHLGIYSPHMCDVTHPLFTRLFCCYIFVTMSLPTAKAPAQILTHSKSKDVPFQS